MLETILSPHNHTQKSSMIPGIIAGIVSGICSAGLLLFLVLQGYAPFLVTNQNGNAPQLPPLGGTVKVVEDSGTVEVVKKSLPSVVSVIATKELKQFNYFDSRDFFDNFSGRSRGQDTQEKRDHEDGEQDGRTEKRRVGGGSGFIISADGMILTNKHVVADTQAQYSVVTSDGKEYQAKIIAKDPVNDVAILKIDGKNFPFLALGDSQSVQIGQTVIAIGNTLGEYRNTVTKGVVSGINRNVQASGYGKSETIQEAIQTDAAINAGNSGGPLLNLAGQVIGINTAVSLEGQSIGFALPIAPAIRSVESVKKHGRIVRPWLGIRYTIVDEEFAKKNNLKVNYGAFIIGNPEKKELGVITGGPAAKAGLAEGDIILELNGTRIDETHALVNEIVKYKPGDTVNLKVFSRENEKNIKVTLEEYKELK